MKTLFYTFLLIFFCSITSFGQKKYIVKITTLDNKIYKGLLFQVDDEGIYILPNNVHWDLKKPFNNMIRSKFTEFGLIKQIQLRKQGSVGIGVVVGLIASIGLTSVIVKAPGTSLGGAIG